MEGARSLHQSYCIVELAEAVGGHDGQGNAAKQRLRDRVRATEARTEVRHYSTSPVFPVDQPSKVTMKRSNSSVKNSKDCTQHL